MFFTFHVKHRRLSYQIRSNQVSHLLQLLIEGATVGSQGGQHIQPQKMKKMYDESRYGNAHELLHLEVGNGLVDPPMIIKYEVNGLLGKSD